MIGGLVAIFAMYLLWIFGKAERGRSSAEMPEPPIRLTDKAKQEVLEIHASWKNSIECRKRLSKVLGEIGLGADWNPSGTICRLGLRRQFAVTDGDMVSVVWLASYLPFVEELSLCHCPITDKSIKHLKNISNVGCLRVIFTKLSAEGLDRLERELPAVRIER